MKNCSLKGASLLVLGLGLSACGGSNGGTVSTPTPTPTPATFTYRTLAELTGNQTFNTAGVAATLAPGVPASNSTAYNSGSGVTFVYTAANDSYQLTSPEGNTVQMTAADIDAARSNANQTVYDRTAGNTRDIVSLIRPSVNSVALTYTLLGSWNHIDTTNGVNRLNLSVGGVPTQAGDIPTTGTANYDMLIGGGGISNGTGYTLTGFSTGEFSINFANGQVNTSMNLMGQQVGTTAMVDFGAITATGTLAAGTPNFSGSIASAGYMGAFAGGIFGPKGSEAAYAWYLSNPTTDLRGINVGRKR